MLNQLTIPIKSEIKPKYDHKTYNTNKTQRVTIKLTIPIKIGFAHKNSVSDPI